MKYSILILSVLCLFLTSCARTLSSEDPIITLDITLTTKENINLNNTIFIVAFSSNSTPAIKPTLLENPNTFFLFPGRSFNDAQLALTNETTQTFYETTFSTWQRFIYISGSKTYFTDSNNSFFDSTTTNNDDYPEETIFEYSQSIVNNKLNLSFDINQINYTENETIYFSIFSFTRDANYESGFIQDLIGETQSIQLTKQQVQTQTLLENSAINGSVDLIKYQCTVY